MNIFKLSFSILFCALIFSNLICLSLANENISSNNTTANISLISTQFAQSTLPPNNQNLLTDEDCLTLANQNLDRSLNLLNSILSAIQTLLTIIGIIIAIVIAIGGYYIKKSFNRIESVKKQAEETHIELQTILQKAKENYKEEVSDIGIIPVQSEPSKETLDKVSKFDDTKSSRSILETFGIELDLTDYMNLASSNFYKKNYLTALQLYNKVISIDNNHSDAWYSKGLTLDRLGIYEEALEAYDKAISIKPNMYEAWHGKGITLHRLGKYQGALQAYDKALSINPTLSNASFNIACTYSVIGNIAKSIEHLKRAIELNPEYKEKAKEDADFDNIKSNPEFRKLVYDE